MYQYLGKASLVYAPQTYHLTFSKYSSYFIRRVSRYATFQSYFIVVFFFKNDCGLLFQDFLELSERLRVFEEKEKDRMKCSQVQSKETAQGQNDKVSL